MKILFVSTSSGSRGGGELYLIYLAKKLRQHGMEVALWCATHERMDELATSFSEWGKVFRSFYVNTYDRNSRSLRYLWPSSKIELYQAVLDFSPDVIHLNKQNTEDGLDLVRLLDNMKVKYVITVHITQSQSSLHAQFGKFRDAVSKYILRHSGFYRLVAISPNRLDDLKSFLQIQDRIVMIPNAVNVPEKKGDKLREETRRNYHISDEHLVVVCVGRLEQQKSPMKFVEWARHCIGQYSGLRFYWVGDGSLREEFEATVNRLELNDQIQCVGWQKEVEPFYAMADIYLHTAEFEGLAFSILEAMSWGVPVVLPDSLYEDIGFAPDVIQKDLQGLIELIVNKQKRMTAGETCREYIISNYSWDCIIHSYIALYQKCIRIDV